MIDYKEKAKGLLLNRVYGTLDKKEFKFKQVKYSKNKFKTENYNDEVFLNWLTNLLIDKYGVKDAQALHVNSNNDNFLNKQLSSMCYLAYSPTIDDELEDDEYYIDLEKKDK